MTTETPATGGGAPAAQPAEASPRPGVKPASFVDEVIAEWVKFRTIRSTWISLLVGIVLMIGLGALIAWAGALHYRRLGGADIAEFDPTTVALTGLIFAQLAIGVLGVLVVTNEYSSGLIRTTLQAVPRRWQVLAAKALVFTVVTLIAGEIGSFVTFLVTQPILHSYPNVPYATLGGTIHGGIHPGHAGIFRAVAGGGLYLAAVGLLSLGIGCILRHTAGAIATVVALLFVFPLVSDAFPSSWGEPIREYLPSTAGGQVYATQRFHLAHHLGPWPGFLILCLYVAAALIGAWFVLDRRDA